MVNQMKSSLQALILLIFSFCSLNVAAEYEEPTDRQAQFMAVYLLHFANFIEWPTTVSADEGQFNICSYASGTVNMYIRELAGEKINNDSRINVLEAPSDEDLAQCQIVFFDTKNISLFHKIKQKTQERPILFVSDHQGFIQQGGTMEYFIEGNKLRFAVNITLAKNTGLILSSKLLRIAKVVE